MSFTNSTEGALIKELAGARFEITYIKNKKDEGFNKAMMDEVIDESHDLINGHLNSIEDLVNDLVNRISELERENRVLEEESRELERVRDELQDDVYDLKHEVKCLLRDLSNYE